MINRIQDLAEQAKRACEPHINDPLEYSFAYRNKFAELIIKECANQCTYEGPFSAEMIYGREFRAKILNHFGINDE